MVQETHSHNLKFIDINHLFVDNIQTNIFNDLKKYGLLNKPLTNKDVKRLFYHYVIHYVCETLLNGSKIGKPIILLNINGLPVGKLNDYSKPTEIVQLIEKILDKLEKMLPVRVVKITEEYSKIKQSKDMYVLLLNESNQKVKTTNSKDFTLQKIKLFAKRHELTFLSDDYLNRLKTKQLLI